MGVLQGLLSKGEKHAALVHPHAGGIQGHFRGALERCAGADGEDREDREREARGWKEVMVLLKKAIEAKGKEEEKEGGGGGQPMLLT